ncbi:MAG: hypothetical protein ACJAXL_001584 [Alphaproteobacteria bacterium]|jgi:hypothetical protein
MSSPLKNGVHNHQRMDAKSNAHAGNDFEGLAQAYFSDKENIELQKVLSLHLSANMKTYKAHNFDLGSKTHNILVECKSHRWTSSGKMPSAKITTWYQAMYYFYLAPKEYTKILFVLKDKRNKTGETLAEYFMRLHSHIIPQDVEIWEYDPQTHDVIKYK